MTRLAQATGSLLAADADVSASQNRPWKGTVLGLPLNLLSICSSCLMLVSLALWKRLTAALMALRAAPDGTISSALHKHHTSVSTMIPLFSDPRSECHYNGLTCSSSRYYFLSPACTECISQYDCRILLHLDCRRDALARTSNWYHLLSPACTECISQYEPRIYLQYHCLAAVLL